MLVNTVLLIATLRTTGLLLTRFPNAGALVLEDQGPALGKTVSEPVTEDLAERRSQRMLLVFLSTECALCRRIAPSVGSMQRRGVNRVVLIRGDAEAAESLMALLGRNANRFSRVDNEIFVRVGIDMTPFALLLDESRRVIAKGIVNSREQLESLFEPSPERMVQL